MLGERKEILARILRLGDTNILFWEVITKKRLIFSLFSATITFLNKKQLFSLTGVYTSHRKI